MCAFILSERLNAVAQMVTPGRIVADIGCDHAYLAIYLVKNDICPRVIACDINSGPLKIANTNIKESGLTDKIDIRQADGLNGIQPGQADCICIAGMGGRLMARIIKEGRNVLGDVREMILEPQSETAYLRHELENEGFMIISEDMVSDDDKFYPIIKAVHGDLKLENEIYYRYGKILIEENNPVLHNFLLKEKRHFTRLLNEISANNTIKATDRLTEIKKDYDVCNKALDMMKYEKLPKGI